MQSLSCNSLYRNMPSYAQCIKTSISARRGGEGDDQVVQCKECLRAVALGLDNLYLVNGRLTRGFKSQRHAREVNNEEMSTSSIRFRGQWETSDEKPIAVRTERADISYHDGWRCQLDAGIYCPCTASALATGACTQPATAADVCVLA
jgi:hypothetical protein